METGKSKSEERSQLLTDPVVTGIAYEINKANKQLNQHRLQVSTPCTATLQCWSILSHVFCASVCTNACLLGSCVLWVQSFLQLAVLKGGQAKLWLNQAWYVQVLLRWALQYGVGAVCEAAGKEIDRANVGVFEWSLSEKDFKKLSNIKPSWWLNKSLITVALLSLCLCLVSYTGTAYTLLCLSDHLPSHLSLQMDYCRAVRCDLMQPPSVGRVCICILRDDVHLMVDYLYRFCKQQKLSTSWLCCSGKATFTWHARTICWLQRVKQALAKRNLWSWHTC